MTLSNDLLHYGIPGMKWGVRRFQNKDGSWTKEGLKRRVYRNRVIRAGKTKADVDDIISTMSQKDKERLGLPDDGQYLYYEQGSYVLKRILIKDGDTPVSFFDLLDDGDSINTVIGTRSGEQYRGKGYAMKAAKKGMEWYEKNKDKLEQKRVLWGVVKDNEGSIKIAKKLGFTDTNEDEYTDGRGYTWVVYEKK